MTSKIKDGEEVDIWSKDGKLIKTVLRQGGKWVDKPTTKKLLKPTKLVGCPHCRGKADDALRLQAENNNLKEEVRRNCDDRKKYLDERNRLKSENLTLKENRDNTIVEKDSIIANLRSDVRTEQDAQDELNETNRRMYDHIIDLKAEVGRLKEQNEQEEAIFLKLNERIQQLAKSRDILAEGMLSLENVGKQPQGSGFHVEYWTPNGLEDIPKVDAIQSWIKWSEETK